MNYRSAAAYMVGGLMALGIVASANSSMAEGYKNIVGDTKSGYHYSKPATQSIQDDDFNNPSFLWVDQGEQLWSAKDGKAGKSCATCHDNAAKSMKGVGATYPKIDAKSGKLLNLEQRINSCRKNNMQAKPWKWESDQLLGMTAYVKLQSRGMPVNVSIDGAAKAYYDKGKKFYNQRRGMLDMSCSGCHVDNAGNMVRADLLSSGLPNGFPTYRLKWQKIGSLHRRFRGCNKNIRAKPYKAGSDEYTALELFVTHRSNGLKVEAPSVRR